MESQSTVNSFVDTILTSILQWRVSWLEEQRKNLKPPPICRAEAKKLKITYDSYKDYESTFIPLLMHEIWAQIYEEWLRLENQNTEYDSMDLDVPVQAQPGANPLTGTQTSRVLQPNQRSCFDSNASHQSKQIWIGVSDYRSDGFKCLINCQYLVESYKLNNHLKLIGEGDLVSLELAANYEPQQTSSLHDYTIDPTKKSSVLTLLGYITDVTNEKLTKYSKLADCFTSRPDKSFHIVNYHVTIAKRPLRLRLNEPMKMACLYYLKPMIRQIESVATLRESALASDILSPKMITCQLSVPTIVPITSTLYNDQQYKAIIGANEAMVRTIPKIQLIQGPPGTGKTHTLIGIIKNFYLKWSRVTNMPKILICAPSNGAIDEVARRLYIERHFLKKGPARRSLRLVRVGNPDHISESVKSISLEELVETNANSKISDLKKKHNSRLKELEDELSKCDTEISNLRYSHREKEIPSMELKIASLLRTLESVKATDEVSAKRQVSEAAKKNMRYELIRNADVILTTLNSCQKYPLDVLFKGELSFHCVIVDEASQCYEPELLMPLCYKISKMVLIGDPMQLPATVISRHAQDFDFGRSMFERFFIHFGQYSPSSPIAMLTDQYRMHPDICRFPSMQFYDNRLVNAVPVKFYPLKSYVMFDLRHSSESKSNKRSIENEVEANFVRTVLLAVLTRAQNGATVGVITPYKGQKRLITNKIRDLQSEKDIKVDVNTCDGFQGQEKDIIILSCVRSFESHGSIGFLKSFQRINVALTRAKHSLIVCIATKSLSKDKIWNALIDDTRQRGCIETLTHTPSVNVLTNMLSPVEHKSVKVRPASSDIENRNKKMFKSDIEQFAIPMDID